MQMHFDQIPHWKISDVAVHWRFFKALPLLVDYDSILYLESYSEHEELLEFILPHRAPESLHEPVFAASSDPGPTWTEHLLLTPDFLVDMERFYDQWNFPPANHIHCYKDGKLLFWFHDAFFDDMEVSGDIPAGRVRQFCDAMAPIYRRVN